jgi:hypothetical protein
MNAHQRRKLTRKLGRTAASGSQHRFVRHWADLAQVPESKTHRLEIDVDGITGAPSSAQTASGWTWLQARELAYRAGQTGQVAYVHVTELALNYASEGERPGQAKAAAMLLLDFVRGTQNLPW